MDDHWLEQHALRYAARWETTRRGVAELLERKVRERCDRTGESPEDALPGIPEVVERLVARRYVDDRRFASQLFERLRRQGRSRAQIRMQLRRKGVPDAITLELTRDEAEPEAELRAAWRLARRRRLGPYAREPDRDPDRDPESETETDPERRRARRERHLAVLARQGFSLEIACRVVDAPDAADPDGIFSSIASSATTEMGDGGDEGWDDARIETSEEESL